MQSWIALLRGINVGGHNKVPMAELREACGQAGFRDVATYIQSGNVVLRAEGPAGAVAARLRTLVAERFDCDVPVVLRSSGALEKVASSNPFLGQEVDEKELHVGFLLEEPSASRLADLPDQPPGPETFRVAGADVYLHYPRGIGGSKLTTAWLDRAFGTTITVRNWRTVNKLVEMGRAVDRLPL
jgi:uncharacterized protein (DUF1697 family)